MAAIGSEVKRVNVLLVASKLVQDALGSNFPDLFDFVRQAMFSEKSGKLTRIILSSAPVARYLPSGLKQTLLI